MPTFESENGVRDGNTIGVQGRAPDMGVVEGAKPSNFFLPFSTA